MPNNRQYNAGNFTTPTLTQLKHEYKQLNTNTQPNNNLKLIIIYGDIGHHNTLPINNNSTIQVSTHVNCLHTTYTPELLTPDDGITAYAENFHKQGITCTIATGASTIYINYFINLNNTDASVDSLHIIQQGQSVTSQLDILDITNTDLNNNTHSYYNMNTGHLTASTSGFRTLASILENNDFIYKLK